MITVAWNSEMKFDVSTPTGHMVRLDAYPPEGEPSTGPTPVEMLLASMAACSGMDVISILAKKRQKVTSYRVEVDGVRGPEGEYPRPFVKMTVRHIVDGENLDPVAVARAVELSDQKYCTVMTTLRAAPEIVSEWVIATPTPA